MVYYVKTKRIEDINRDYFTSGMKDYCDKESLAVECGTLYYLAIDENHYWVEENLEEITPIGFVDGKGKIMTWTGWRDLNLLKGYEKEGLEETRVMTGVEPTMKVNEKDPIYLFENITSQMLETYKKKNSDYGDSFGKQFEEFGIISALVRIGDKYNRVKSLAKGKTRMVDDEKIEDTLLDMANYCIMTLIQMKKWKLDDQD